MSGHAQEAAPAAAPALTFERVFASPSLDGPAPRAMKLSPDGQWLTLLRPRSDDRLRYDLWGYERATGQWRMLVDSLKLGSGRELSEAEKMQRERQRIGDLKGIVTYSWTADGRALLVPVDGVLYLAGLDGSQRKLDGAGAEEGGGALNPALSPKGGYVSFVKDRRLWVGALGKAPGAVTPAEAAETVHWGEAEFVAQEELDRSTGTWWSPDDKRIAVERFDEAPVKVVTRAAIGADGTRTFDQRYPAAGTPNADVSLHLVDPDGGRPATVDLGGRKEFYIARVDWAKDGGTLYVQVLDRAQSKLDLLAVDPATGKSRVLFTENAAKGAWINVIKGASYKWLADGSLVWTSERSGFAHLYRYKNGKWTALTRGDWPVTGLLGVDEAAGKAFFTAMKDDPLAPNVYSVDFKGGSPVLLSETGFANAATMDGKGQTLIVTRSSPDQPPQSYLAGPDGKRVTWIEENRVEGQHPYAPYLVSHRETRFGTLKAADGSVLHYRMIAPPLVAGKRYPVFFSHYGGPHSQVVTRGWGGALPQAIADKGYIYFEIDNRGSANRGVAFEKQISHAMGSVEVADQKVGADYLKTLPYVDPAKIATFGWSYGGYMTLMMLAQDPGEYAAGIAVAPVTRWDLYDTAYTERYLGDPRTVPEVYKATSPLTVATRIKDPLLVIHGMADDNVVLDNTTALAGALQDAAVPFEMMLYPGKTHAIAGPKARQHLYEGVFAFLARHGVTPPE
ncbi:DPP IV N-terminal domain-containing protein [Parablastomonas sp. CN1-191]|uniref:S9 family peptidase n=1 Tax=Parablastomonas sp. CN1-191 TaxID=3400908 RepID=UPI003BF8FC81